METQVKQISLDLLDAPNIAMRTDVDGDDIQRLMTDMTKVGLMEPIIVRVRGDRYEIIAGHRRSRAARLLGWGSIEAKIMEATDEQTLEMRLIENLSRHEVDPVDEAVYIGEIMQQYNFTEDDVAEKLGRSIEWVRNRVCVFNMPDYMQEGLKLKQIPLGAALHLNDIENDLEKRHYTMWARTNGISVSQARQWLAGTRRPEHTFNAEVAPVYDGTTQTQETVTLVHCDRCRVQVDLRLTDSVWVHMGSCPS